MKKVLCILLCLSFFFLFAGCVKSQPSELPDEGNFHYVKKELTYHTSDGFIDSEKRDIENYSTDDLKYVLNTYLAGPENDELVSPFPNGTVVKDITHKNSIFSITLSDQFSELTGYDLSVACACLTLTVSEFVDAKLVQISAENTKLGGNQRISMNTDRILLIDSLNLIP